MTSESMPDTPNHVMHVLGELQSIGGLKGVDIANVADVSKATVSRWATKKKTPHPTTQRMLSDLHYLVMRLNDYYSAREIRDWLYAMHPQLDGARAIDLLHQNRVAEVLGILNRLDSDAYL
jgi:uncharacterized protein (DUF2384 family)